MNATARKMTREDAQIRSIDRVMAAKPQPWRNDGKVIRLKRVQQKSLNGDTPRYEPELEPVTQAETFYATCKSVGVLAALFLGVAAVYGIVSGDLRAMAVWSGAALFCDAMSVGFWHLTKRAVRNGD